MIAICALAITLRLLFLASWAATPLFQAPYGDEQNFHLTALALIDPDARPQAFLYQPLYSFYLAGLYSIFGPDPALVRSLQLLVSLAGLLVFYGLGRELAGPACGKLAALAIALYGPLVFFEGHLLAPGIVVPLAAAALWCLLRAGLRDRTWLLAPAGALLGLAAMGRPNLLVLVAPAGLWWLWRQAGWKARLAGLGLAACGLAAGLSPAWIHNAVQGAGFVPISTAGGISFYIGNSPGAKGRFYVPRGERIDASSHAAYRASLAAIACRAEGRALDDSEVSAYWYRRGLGFWAEQPAQAVALVGRKLVLAVNSEEMPIHNPYFVGVELVPVLGLLLRFGVLFAFAVLGAVLYFRVRGVGLLVASALVYLGSLLVFYVADRYRIQLVPMLVPLAALGVIALSRLFRSRGLLRSWPALALLAVAFAATQPPAISDAARTRAFVGAYNLMGKASGDRGDLDQAERYFQKAVALAGPGHGAAARANLGLIMEKRGQLDSAMDWYRQAAQIDPENRFSRRHLAQLAERRGEIEAALRWWEDLRAIEADPREAEQAIARLRARLERP
ncbi:MAG: glycosyltransferase family 39 protein [Deltaproteobacteria bacterium]|nr:glycosyltransferase family 39 protein [Deltaproteobacteria bacterium]